MRVPVRTAMRSAMRAPAILAMGHTNTVSVTTPATKTVIGAALLALTLQTSAGTSLMPREQLLEYCKQSATEQANLCLGYIMGAADAGAVCVPDGINTDTLKNLVMATLQDANSNDTPARSIQHRLAEVFPCDDRVSDDTPPHKSVNWSNKERMGK